MPFYNIKLYKSIISILTFKYNYINNNLSKLNNIISFKDNTFTFLLYSTFIILNIRYFFLRPYILKYIKLFTFIIIILYKVKIALIIKSLCLLSLFTRSLLRNIAYIRLYIFIYY